MVKKDRFTLDKDNITIKDNFNNTICECKYPNEAKEYTRKLNKLYNDVKKLSIITDKQIRFIKDKGYENTEYIEFAGEQGYKYNATNKRFENSGRLIIDTKTNLHYIMTLDWEVILIVKLLNNYEEKNHTLEQRLNDYKYKIHELKYENKVLAKSLGDNRTIDEYDELRLEKLEYEYKVKDILNKHITELKEEFQL